MICLSKAGRFFFLAPRKKKNNNNNDALDADGRGEKDIFWEPTFFFVFFFLKFKLILLIDQTKPFNTNWKWWI